MAGHREARQQRVVVPTKVRASESTYASLVSYEDDEAWDRLVDELVARESAIAEQCTDEGAGLVAAHDEGLLALGVPVAVLDDSLIPDVSDPDADVHEAAVVNIEVLRLRRHLRQLTAVERKAVCLRWGIGCQAQSQEQIAVRMGMTRAGVRWTLRRALSRLREQYGLGEAA